MLTHTTKVDLTPRQYQRIKLEQRRYAKAQLRKQQENKSLGEVDKDEIILIENEEDLKNCNGLLGEQSLKDKASKEEPSNSIAGPSRSQKGIAISSFQSYCIILDAFLKAYVSGECTKVERADDPMEGSSSLYSCTGAMESGHDPKVDVGLITQENVTVKYESIADENHDNVCLKTGRLSPSQREADSSVENELKMPTKETEMMPTLPSTPPWDEEDRPPRPVVSTSAESIQEQKLDAPKETNESSKAVHGGAVWDIFRREDVPKLVEYLKRHKHEFRHLYNEPVKSVSIITCK